MIHHLSYPENKSINDGIPPEPKLTVKELQSLIGLLNFACNIVSPGRSFLRRLIDLTMGIKKQYYKLD